MLQTGIIEPGFRIDGRNLYHFCAAAALTLLLYSLATMGLRVLTGAPLYLAWFPLIARGFFRAAWLAGTGRRGSPQPQAAIVRPAHHPRTRAGLAGPICYNTGT